MPSYSRRYRVLGFRGCLFHPISIMISLSTLLPRRQAVLRGDPTLTRDRTKKPEPPRRADGAGPQWRDGYATRTSRRKKRCSSQRYTLPAPETRTACWFSSSDPEHCRLVAPCPTRWPGEPCFGQRNPPPIHVPGGHAQLTGTHAHVIHATGTRMVRHDVKPGLKRCS